MTEKGFAWKPPFIATLQEMALLCPHIDLCLDNTPPVNPTSSTEGTEGKGSADMYRSTYQDAYQDPTKVLIVSPSKVELRVGSPFSSPPPAGSQAAPAEMAPTRTRSGSHHVGVMSRAGSMTSPMDHASQLQAPQLALPRHVSQQLLNGSNRSGSAPPTLAQQGSGPASLLMPTHTLPLPPMHRAWPQQPMQPMQSQPAQPPKRQLEPTESMDRALAVVLHDEELQAIAADAARSFEGATIFEEAPSLIFPEPIYHSSHDLMLTKRLSRAPSTQATPRINSVLPPQQPLVHEDRSRLLLRLDQYDLVEREVKGDGACQFRSLSDQLYGTAEHFASVRKNVVAQLRAKPERYAAYVPGGNYEAYCKEMAKPGTWGDHITLQAAADWFGLKITIVTSYKENCVLHIEPEEKKSARVLWLSFWAEVHYNSLYPRQEPPPPPTKPSKVLGSKKLGRLFGAHE